MIFVAVIVNTWRETEEEVFLYDKKQSDDIALKQFFAEHPNHGAKKAYSVDWFERTIRK